MQQLEASGAGHLAAFFLGYWLLLVIPGPNLLVISAVASTEGVKRCLPLCAGLALGATLALAAILFFLADLAAAPVARSALGGVGAIGLGAQA